jgi:uncharacterized protein YdeI (YjbR/CyaY-like superfamily)
MFPTYVYKGRNLVAMGAFKTYAGIWFFEGSLLADDQKMLMNAQEGKTQAMRQWRFTSIDDLNEAVLHQYILESMANVDNGVKVVYKKTQSKKIIIPKEFKDAFEKSPDIARIFNELSTSKQREFTEYIATAKRQNTRDDRTKKCLLMISKGIGLNDKYR